MNAHVPKKKGCGIEVVVDGDYKQVCGEPWAGEVWYCTKCRRRHTYVLADKTLLSEKDVLDAMPELARAVGIATDFDALKGGAPCTQDGRPLPDTRPRIMDFPQQDAETAKDIIMDVMKPRTAVEILRSAASLLEERGKQYDSATGERSWTRIVTAFNSITGRDLTVEEALLLMGIVKDVRQYISGKRHEDSAIDGVAYAALEAEEILEQLSKGGA